MKKRIIIGISILIGITLIISTFILKKKDNNYQSYNNSGSHLAFYYQDDNGEYVPSTDVKWIEGNYTLNISESICNGTKNPSYLSWNEDDRTVVLSNGVSTSCTLYFDKKPPTIFDKCPDSTDLVSCLNNLQTSLPGDETTTTDLCPNGIGGVIKHDGTIDAKDDGTIDDAGDNGYRYSGCNPNNYICFGKGSEKYNSGEEANCPLKNKYRIIGYVHVTLADGSSTSLIKVIKAEYLTEDEFGTPVGTAGAGSAYAGIKRIESSQSGIPAYKWNDTANNNWKESTLYTSLNSDESNGYKDKAFGENWKDKIETVKWNVGGASSSYTSYNAQKMYEEEMTGQGATTPVDAQIGLMYLHDYGFASSSDNWQTELFNYNKAVNRNNNWLFNGVYEWTISRGSSNSSRAYIVNGAGSVGDNGIVSNSNVAVRPVFYLKSDVKIVGGDGSDGSRTSPLRVK